MSKPKHILFEYAALAFQEVDKVREKNAMTALETCEFYRSQAAKQ